MSAGLRLIASLLDNRSTTTFRLIEPELLVDDDERAVHTFIRNHLRRYGELPTAGTAETETGIGLPNTPECVDFYLQEVHNRHVYTHVRDEFTVLRERIAGTDIAGMLESANSIRRICTPYSGQQRELTTLSEMTSELRAEYVDRAVPGGLTGIPTGWDYLDTETGGYQNGDVIFWVARPGVGKTWTLIHQAMAAHRAGHSVLFVSMEMPLQQIGMRIAAYHCGIDPDKIRKHKLSYFAKRRLDGALVELEDARGLHLFAGNFKKTTDHVEALIHEIGPDAVYIDGSYLMRPSSGNSRMGRYEAAAYVVDDLKRIALMVNRPIDCTTQFGKQAGKGGKDGSLETIGYTDTISTHASVVLALKMGCKHTRPITEAVQVGEDDWQVETIGQRDYYPFREIEILKGREGESGAFAINYKFAPLNFGEVPLHIAAGAMEAPGAPNLDHMI